MFFLLRLIKCSAIMSNYSGKNEVALKYWTDIFIWRRTRSYVMYLIFLQCGYFNTYKHSIGTSTTSVGRNVPFWRPLPPIPVLIFYWKMYSRVKSGRSHTFMLKWMLTKGFLQWFVRALIFAARQWRPSTLPPPGHQTWDSASLGSSPQTSDMGHPQALATALTPC